MKLSKLTTLIAKAALVVAFVFLAIETSAQGTAVSLTPDGNNWYVNMPATGTSTLTLDGSIKIFKVYDDGGKDGNYSDKCDGTLILTAPNGYGIQLSGNITTHNSNDRLTVYDNNEATGSKLLDGVSGTLTDIMEVSSGRSITLYFHSSATYNDAGLDLTARIFDINKQFDITIPAATTGGYISAKIGETEVSSAKTNNVVTLTATPADGYMLCDLTVTDADNNIVPIERNTWSNTATFTMPGSAVTVTPTFTNNLTAESGLFINMPATGTLSVTIPDNITSFKVYDDGGKDGDYSASCDGTLILTAPNGYGIHLSGNITTYNSNDKLTVYDNNEATGSKLLDGVSGTLTDIMEVSSGQSITLYFHSNYTQNSVGLDLTARIFDLNEQFDIAIPAAITGGSISAKIGETEVSSAKPNDVVTLTATPADGYVLSDLTVTDADNNIVPISWNGCLSNTATFIMPGSAVTVTPTFTNNLTAESGLYINMPATGTQTVTIPAGVKSFKVYDDGGKDGNYSDNCDGTLILTAPDGYGIQLSGNITTYNSYDKLTVYDNNEATGSILLDGVSGTLTDIMKYSSGQSITLYFHSNNTQNYAGLDLTARIIDLNEQFDIAVPAATTGGSISAKIGETEVSSAKANDVITLTATPADGYLLRDLTVTDNDNNIVPITWVIWPNTATFTMPHSAVTVTPTFTNNKTANDGLSINMPTTGTQTVTIHAGVKSFKVYDDGGKDGNYSDNCDGTLILTAPNDYGIQLSGNIKTYNSNDKLTVYDNNEATGSILLDGVSGTLTDIMEVSSGQSITLYFYSNYTQNSAGLDLTARIFDLNEQFDIAIPAAITGGSISAKIGETEVSSAKANDVITLTATPADGYLLSVLTVTDADNNIVPISWNGWLSNTATFTMPGSAVTVTPTFTNNLTAESGLYINMPATGTQTVTIPAGVKSFKVYDDGGKDGNYSDNCDGTLILTAPDGYCIQLSGNITTYNSTDELTVYDNNEATGSILLGGYGTLTDIMEVSSGQSITLYFYSHSSVNYNDAGLDLTITSIKTLSHADITVADISDQPYTGSAITPDVTIKDGETVLTKDIDYKVEYSDNNINVGTATATITGIGNYNGTIEKTFSIVPRTKTIGAITFSTDQNGTTASIDGNYTADDALSITEDITVTSVTLVRNFTTGKYATVVLPFAANVNASDGIFYTFGGVTYDEDKGAWIASVSPVTLLEAHTPYIFEPNGNWTSLTWNADITIYTKPSSATTTIIDPEYGEWTFKGVYEPESWADRQTTIYGFAGGDKTNRDNQEVHIGDFVRAGYNSSIKPFRCYLEYIGGGTTDLSTLTKSATALPDRIEVRVVNSVIDPADPEDNPNDDIKTPVSEIVPTANVKVWSYDKTIYIAAVAGTNYRIIDTNGRDLASGITATDRDEIHLGNHSGIVIVIINGKTYKINY